MRKILLALMLLPLAWASTLTLGQFGHLALGRTVRGTNGYFIGIGNSVIVERAWPVAVALGQYISVMDVNGDLYALGEDVSIEGNVRNAYVWASRLEVSGNVEGNLVAYVGTLRVSGNVGTLTGEAKSAEITGSVGRNALKIKKEQAEDPMKKVWEWFSGAISALVMLFILRKLNIEWKKEYLKDMVTYVYGLGFVTAPFVLLVLFILSLLLLPLANLFAIALGVLLSLFGAWLVVLMLAGVPIYEVIGRFAMRSPYAAVVVGYTAVYAVSLVAGWVWLLVVIAGAGMLIRGVKEHGWRIGR